jgi:hypothetical protein
VCEELDDLCEALGRYVAGFDPGLVTTQAAGALVGRAARAASTAEALLPRRPAGRPRQATTARAAIAARPRPSPGGWPRPIRQRPRRRGR